MYDELLNQADSFCSVTKRRIENAYMPYIASGASSVVEMVAAQSAAIRDLTAKLEAVKPRPIEEAPKDGSTVLALWDGRWVETYWVKRDKFEGWQMPSGMVVKAYAPDTWKPTLFIPLSALTALEK